ncbi:MAG: MBL fold metallo-hydrolase [Asgard group archaeon]|nr:MBL fold metallo-hydrolase [Asgard group archaeon]
MVKITMFGAAQEIGRSAILVEDKDTKIMLDCGLKIRPKKPSERPHGVDEHAPELNGVLISHAHFDHTGYLPGIVRSGYEGLIHMTKPTRDITSILLRDHLKIEGQRHWTEENLYDFLYQTELHYYNKKFKVADGVTAEFFDAGHILGSASILIDWKGQLIFYTGDINTFETPYHDTNNYPTVDDISIVISEATNGLRDLPNRETPNTNLVDDIYDIHMKGGKTIIPTFSLGRAQEIEAILAREFNGSKFTIYVDGMILKMNDVYRRFFHEYWVSKKILNWCREQRIAVPFDSSNFIPINRNLADDLNTYRNMIVNEKRPNIILSTSGMLEGGPIHSYLYYGAHNPDNLIALTGYQVEETLGREILDGKRNVRLFSWSDKGGAKIKIKSQVKQYRFSGHAQRNELLKMLQAINSENILFVHGKMESAQALKEDLGTKYNISIPKIKETVKYEN